MKAVVYQGIDSFTIEERPKPDLLAPTDAIVRMVHTTICGTDLHILHGDVPSCTPGRILGHEGVGVIDSLGTGVSNFAVGDTVLISCITSCGMCRFCRKGMSSSCETGGWILGHMIDGTQAEYVRIPHARTSLYHLPESIDPQLAVTISDVLPTAYECGLLNGSITPGASVAIVGAGPIGLAALVMAKRLYGPAEVTVIGRGESRLAVAAKLGADHTFSSLQGFQEVVTATTKLTNGLGFDVVIEAVGTAESFEMSQALIGAGGTIASLGVFGEKCDLHLERLWNRNICMFLCYSGGWLSKVFLIVHIGIKTRLVDTVAIPELLRMMDVGVINPEFLVSHSKYPPRPGLYEGYHESI